MKYEPEEIRTMLERRGARFSRNDKEIDASRMRAGVVGINSLGLLERMRDLGYRVILPEVEYSPKKGYRGISRP